MDGQKDVKSLAAMFESKIKKQPEPIKPKIEPKNDSSENKVGNLKSMFERQSTKID